MTPLVDPFDLVRAQVLLAGYDARWAEEMSSGRYLVLAVEAEYRCALVNPETGAPSRTWQRGGKIDAIVHDTTEGADKVVEHKTSSEDITVGSPYWAKLRMDGQVSGYFLGADALGFKPAACLYDVLKKPGLRPYKIGAKRKADETPEEFRERLVEAVGSDPAGYFQRGEVVRLDSEMDDAAFDDWHTAAQLREAQRLGRFPRNPDACFKWGRACSFFDVCTGCASLEDRTRFRQSEHVSPELTAAGGLPVLSASRLRAARSCQRLHRYQYVDGIRPLVEADSLRFGSLIHKGLEAWWTAKNGERLDAALAALTAEPSREETGYGNGATAA